MINSWLIEIVVQRVSQYLIISAADIVDIVSVRLSFDHIYNKTRLLMTDKLVIDKLMVSTAVVKTVFTFCKNRMYLLYERIVCTNSHI